MLVNEPRVSSDLFWTLLDFGFEICVIKQPPLKALYEEANFNLELYTVLSTDNFRFGYRVTR
jgi:hypothetical protein